jgi:integrase/recombinase XerD
MKTKLNDYKTYLINIKRSLVYYNYLIGLADYLEEKNLTFETLTKEQLAQYFTDKNYSPNSINNVIKSCRDYAKFLKIDKHPSFEIKMLEVMSKERQYMTYEELLQGIKYYATYSQRGMSANKCSVILKFCFFVSIRKSELFTLTRDKIDLTNCSALVLGIKDKTERLVYFPNSFVKELADYFNSEPEEKNAFNITLAEFNYLTRKIGKYINKKVTPHTLRHSGGKYMVKKNINPITMQRIMGHNSLQTTLIYCAIDDKQAEENYHTQIK